MARDRSGEANRSITSTFDQTQLKELKRAIQDAGKEARRSVRKQLKAAGTILTDEIKRRTPVAKYQSSNARRATATGKRNRGRIRTARHRPGLLKRSTKLKMGSLSVAVYNDAKAVSRKYSGGYRYGKRLEFDPAYSARLAFFYPGVDAAEGRALAALNKVLDDAAAAYLRG